MWAQYLQDDAAEMVRRAEWALGKAVKAGQARGDVTSNRDNRRGGHDISRAEESFASDYFSHGQERVDVTTMASVDSDTFEAALTEARAEGNLSRGNVLAKVKAAGSHP